MLADGESVTEPQPTVLQVLLPGTNPEIRLATLERDSDALELRKVTLDSVGSLVMGKASRVRLSSIGFAEARGNNVVLRAGGPAGPALVEFKLEDAETAASWAAALRPSSSADANSATAKFALAGERTVDTLRKLIEQQEEQLRLLESINERKEEQLLSCQRQLEQSLDDLQKGQITYTTQHQTLEKQQKAIDSLYSMLQAAGAAEAACLANEAEVSRGVAAAARAGGAGVVAAALQQRDLSQKPRNGTASEGSATASGPDAGVLPPQARPSPPSALPKELQAVAAATAGVLGRSRDGEAAEANDAPAVMAQLAALQNAKAHYEESLRKEQEEVHLQMQKLQEMMGAFGIAAPGSDSD